MNQEKIGKFILEQRKEKKNKLIITLISLVFIIILSIVLIFEFKKNKDLEDSQIHVVYKDGIYTNNNGVKLTINEGKIIEFMDKTEEDLKTITEDEKNALLTFYYSELEAFRMNGFIGTFNGSEKINDILVLNMTSKRTSPFVLTKEIESNEKYCFLGTTKYGTFLIGEYKNNTCVVNDVVCSYAKLKDSTLKVNINDYCK